MLLLETILSGRKTRLTLDSTKPTPIKYCYLTPKSEKLGRVILEISPSFRVPTAKN